MAGFPKKETRKIDHPEVRNAGKYGILCCIPYGRSGSEFSFGLTKAKAIKEYYKFICKFIDDQEQVKIKDFEGDPAVEAMVEARKQQILEQENDSSAYLRQILKAHESDENYEKFREEGTV